MKLSAHRFGLHDQAWCLVANRWAARRAVRIYFQTISRLGDGILWYALIAAVALLGGTEGLLAALQMSFAGGIGTLLYRRLKHWTRRPRPFASDTRIEAWVAPLDEFSFPSGHTLHAVGLSLIACWHFPVLATVLLPFTVSVAASRVVLGMHYPSDVLAATAIGLLLGSLAICLM